MTQSRLLSSLLLAGSSWLLVSLLGSQQSLWHATNAVLAEHMTLQLLQEVRLPKSHILSGNMGVIKAATLAECHA